MRPLTRAIVSLGLTQIVGYGTCYYAYAILAPAVATEFGVSAEVLFGIFSAALLAGGFASPWLGAAMDRFGAARLMPLGSLLIAILMLALSAAPGTIAFGGLFILVEIAGVLVLYQGAFAALAHLGGGEARRAITLLTLFGGFASTIFWPLTGWALPLIGWRSCYLAFALAHLLIALPLHLMLARRGPPPHNLERPAPGPAAAAPKAHLDGRLGQVAFVAVALAFALSNFVAASFAVHLVGILQSIGLGSAAFAVSMVMGPSQVLVRLTEAIFGRAVHPLTVAIVGGTSLALAALCLLLGQPAIGAAIAFAALFGFGQGLESIVAGTVPLALFDRSRYGALTGKLNAARLLLGATAPFAFSVIVAWSGLTNALIVLVVVGILGVLPLIALRLHLRSHGFLPPPLPVGQ